MRFVKIVIPYSRDTSIWGDKIKKDIDNNSDRGDAVFFNSERSEYLVITPLNDPLGNLT